MMRPEGALCGHGGYIGYTRVILDPDIPNIQRDYSARFGSFFKICYLN